MLLTIYLANSDVTPIHDHQSQPDDFSAGRDVLRATGGNIMGHGTTYRILLRKAGKVRIAIMVDSPYHMYDQTMFSVRGRCTRCWGIQANRVGMVMG